jgi:hypothetical protein
MSPKPTKSFHRLARSSWTFEEKPYIAYNRKRTLPEPGESALASLSTNRKPIAMGGEHPAGIAGAVQEGKVKKGRSRFNFR